MRKHRRFRVGVDVFQDLVGVVVSFVGGYGIGLICELCIECVLLGFFVWVEAIDDNIDDCLFIVVVEKYASVVVESKMDGDEGNPKRKISNLLTSM